MLSKMQKQGKLRGWFITNYEDTVNDDMKNQFMSAAQDNDIDMELKAAIDIPICPDLLPKPFPDFVLAYLKNTDLLQVMEDAGIPVFNSVEGIAKADSKIKTVIALWKAGVPQPKTIAGPHTRGRSKYREPERFLAPIINEFGYPFIIKGEYGSFGETVYLVKDEMDLAECPLLQGIENRFIAQEFIEESKGTDVRVVVVGDEIVYSKRRCGAKGNFRSNIGAGGHNEEYTPTQEERDIALAATHALGLHWAGVDVLQSERGPVVCEVNSNPHWTAWDIQQGANYPDAYYKYIKCVLRGVDEKSDEKGEYGE